MKTKELLPLARDEKCEEVFNVLADFAQEILAIKKERRSSHQLDQLKLEDLIKMKKGKRIVQEEFVVLIIDEKQKRNQENRKREF